MNVLFESALAAVDVVIVTTPPLRSGKHGSLRRRAIERHTQRECADLERMGNQAIHRVGSRLLERVRIDFARGDDDTYLLKVTLVPSRSLWPAGCRTTQVPVFVSAAALGSAGARVDDLLFARYESAALSVTAQWVDMIRAHRAWTGEDD